MSEGMDLQHALTCYLLDELPICGFQVGRNHVVSASSEPIWDTGKSPFMQPGMLILCGLRSAFSEICNVELHTNTDCSLVDVPHGCVGVTGGLWTLFQWSGDLQGAVPETDYC